MLHIAQVADIVIGICHHRLVGMGWLDILFIYVV